MSHANLTLGKLAVPLLILLGLLIYYPVFFNEYAYTDEWVHLWHYGKDKDFHMFIPQGRYLTDKLFVWLFGSIDTISELKYIRVFSLCGWLLCVPVWYHVLKRIVQKEGLPGFLPFFSVLYLLCMPGVTISVGWASISELFIAYTAGLLSGYFIYKYVRFEDNRLIVPGKAIFLSLLFGIISLFTYQNGIGCFLLPFLLQWLVNPVINRRLIVCVGFYFFIYLVYYLLFKYSLKVNHTVANDRTAFVSDVFGKMSFFLARTLNTSFHFTLLFNERDLAGRVVYMLLFIPWVIASFYRQRLLPVIQRLKWIAVVLLFFVLIYLPSMIISENFASNRTLISLNMAVLLSVAVVAAEVVKHVRIKRFAVIIVCLFFVLNAGYNFRHVFLYPVKNEYKLVRSFIENSYQPGTDTVFVARPKQDFFYQRYHVCSSWDEFGVPSTHFEWVPEFFVKQVVMEKTGNRKTADKLIIKSWPYNYKPLELAADSLVVVDVQKLMRL